MVTPGYIGRFLLFLLFSCFICMPAAAVDYNDFPSELQLILDERIADLNDAGGICIAGLVTTSDGAPISSGADVQVNLYHGIDEPLMIYNGGWFIMRHTLSSSHAGTGKGFILRAFGYDPIDASITILDGEMTYLEFVMMKTPPEDIASVEGTVVDEDDYPFNGAYVSLSFPFASIGNQPTPTMSMPTSTDGQYSFTGLSVCEHRLTASASEYAYHTGTFTPPTGGTAVEDRKLYPNRRIIIDYVYQADGSRSFTTGDLQIGTIDWLNGEGGLDLSEGQVKCCGLGRDLNMYQDQDILKFRNYYGCGGNGFYDAGLVEFDSVTEANETGYTTSYKACQVGHVYVVKTCDELNYAKFIVKTDESSFRTVVPGDSAPIEFAGYGLTIDFSDCSDYGKVYVRKCYGSPNELPALPYYWEITGLDGLSYSADLTITYDWNDVVDFSLSENNLALYNSSDNMATWDVLETQTDPVEDTLLVEGLTSFGFFAISATGDCFPDYVDTGDFNGDCNVNFIDYSMMALHWRQNTPFFDISPSPTGDGIVDANDLGVLCDNWLATWP